MTGSNRLASRNANMLTHDAAGNATNNGLGGTYVWNSLGQLSQVNVNGVKKATYLYNYLNQRIQKTVWNGTTVVSTTIYHYDPQGRLVMETSSTGAVQAVYVYGDDPRPLIMIQAANSTYNSTAQDKVVYLQTDHLGTPRLATDAARRVVWRWEMLSDAFGVDSTQQDPDGDGVATVIHLRFPGQYYDVESGLHQNWHRYYDPSLGRYISSDPIGLAGGLNTFGYAYQNPIINSDPDGRFAVLGILPFLGGSSAGTAGASTGMGFWATGAVLGTGLLMAGDTREGEDNLDEFDLPGQCIEPPGDCTEPQLASLQKNKNFACNGPRSCNPQLDSCATLMEKMLQGEMCVSARNRLNSMCFKGGDKAHIREATRASKSISQCALVAAAKGCPGF